MTTVTDMRVLYAIAKAAHTNDRLPIADAVAAVQAAAPGAPGIHLTTLLDCHMLDVAGPHVVITSLGLHACLLLALDEALADAL